jgi:phosphoribosyl 1,2-cyclic phosphate phosphodiesterase
VPYARSGPSVFVHGPDVLIDTPGEITEQLLRSTVRRIAACFYSHWHPDHTMGRGVFSPMNTGYPAWPYRPRRTTPIYLPERVAADARTHLALWDHLKEMEAQEQVVEVHELTDGHPVVIEDVTIRPVPLHEAFAYGFAFESADKRLVVVPDELLGWEPPDDLRGADLAIVPFGVTEFHALSGERRIPAEHPVLDAEATFVEMVEVIRKLEAKRTMVTHIEEAEGLSYDDLLLIERQLAGEGVAVKFAFDTQIISV